MKQLFDDVSIACSRITTRTYSTSFSIGITCLHKTLHDPIYAIYGFVRFADEIVDSFDHYNKRMLLDLFKRDTYLALEEKISLNPILNSFQATVHRYSIDRELIELFLHSMEMDLDQKHYDESELKQYILGSAEVVGLMCLKVFCDGNHGLYQQLVKPAMSLGSAFQKVNFLRDIQADFEGMGRQYFPNVNSAGLNDDSKREIEASIEADFQDAYQGVCQLPSSSRLGVYVAYIYYQALFKKIKNTPSELIMKTRIRVCNRQKVGLLAYSYLRNLISQLAGNY